MGKRRGGKAGGWSAELAERLEREYRFQPHLARQYAGQLADAVGDNLSECTTTSQWVGKEANVPSGFSCFVARAIEDQLAGNGIEDCTGAKRGHAANTSSVLGTTVSPAGETAARVVNATPNVGEIAAHGESAVQQGAKAVPGVNVCYSGRGF